MATNNILEPVSVLYPMEIERQEVSAHGYVTLEFYSRMIVINSPWHAHLHYLTAKTDNFLAVHKYVQYVNDLKSLGV